MKVSKRETEDTRFEAAMIGTAIFGPPAGPHSLPKSQVVGQRDTPAADLDNPHKQSTNNDREDLPSLIGRFLSFS